MGLVWLTNTYAFDDGTPLELLAPGRRPSIDEFQVSPSTLATFVGEYRDSSDVSLYIRLEDEGFLTVQTRGRARMRLYAESEDSFTLDRGGARLVFSRSRDGEITGVRMEPSESGETARKVGTRTPPPRAVAAGDAWHGVGVQWKVGYWIFVVPLALLALLTLAFEARRILNKRKTRA